MEGKDPCLDLCCSRRLPDRLPNLLGSQISHVVSSLVGILISVRQPPIARSHHHHRSAVSQAPSETPLSCTRATTHGKLHGLFPPLHVVLGRLIIRICHQMPGSASVCCNRRISRKFRRKKGA
ncbi:hypothetical protein COCNU_02G017420 [Cocos nucifera]|uniref:Uncharacterized protein n=1 Tax=Cocos nucifera TaxID=13894 RepID=A0A8K0MY55_COCNU|nr:hypothetical protein COCNU_02G017420 [Cocos nucifera]